MLVSARFQEREAATGQKVDVEKEIFEMDIATIVGFIATATSLC